MEKIDARKLSSAALEEKRRLSVRFRKQGMMGAQIGEVVGVHPGAAGRWLKAYEAQGAKALKSQVRRCREGACRTSARSRKAGFRSTSSTRRLTS